MKTKMVVLRIAINGDKDNVMKRIKNALERGGIDPLQVQFLLVSDAPKPVAEFMQNARPPVNLLKAIEESAINIPSGNSFNIVNPTNSRGESEAMDTFFRIADPKMDELPGNADGAIELVVSHSDKSVTAGLRANGLDSDTIGNEAVVTFQQAWEEQSVAAEYARENGLTLK